MAHFWTRGRIKRRLVGLCAAGEDLAILGRLELGGWWAMSDRALYTLGRFDEPTCLPLHDIQSVEVTSRRATVLVKITTATGTVLAADFHQGNELVLRLQELLTPPDPKSL